MDVYMNEYELGDEDEDICIVCMRTFDDYHESEAAFANCAIRTHSLSNLFTKAYCLEVIRLQSQVKWSSTLYIGKLSTLRVRIILHNFEQTRDEFHFTKCLIEIEIENWKFEGLALKSDFVYFTN